MDPISNIFDIWGWPKTSDCSWWEATPPQVLQVLTGVFPPFKLKIHRHLNWKREKSKIIHNSSRLNSQCPRNGWVAGYIDSYPTFPPVRPRWCSELSSFLHHPYYYLVRQVTLKESNGWSQGFLLQGGLESLHFLAQWHYNQLKAMSWRIPF